MSSLSPYQPALATITRIEEQTAMEKLFGIRLNNGQSLGHRPGQFVEISAFGIGECPLSISSAPDKGADFELCVRRAGNVTSALHNLKVGEVIGVRGPYGTHFPVKELKGKDLLFVAGGLGIVPLRSFIHYALQRRKDYGRIIVLFGARTPADRLFKKELASLDKRSDVEYLETVDVGDKSWKGNVGVITTLFPKFKIDPQKTFAIMVGPPVMYRFAIAAARDKGVADDHIIVSLERRMKCGLGKCGHCQMGPIYVCQEGPVFNYTAIKDLEEALS